MSDTTGTTGTPARRTTAGDEGTGDSVPGEA